MLATQRQRVHVPRLRGHAATLVGRGHWLAYRVPPSHDPHPTPTHPWGAGAAPTPFAHLSAPRKKRAVQRPQPSELVPLALVGADVEAHLQAHLLAAKRWMA